MTIPVMSNMFFVFILIILPLSQSSPHHDGDDASVFEGEGDAALFCVRSQLSLTTLQTISKGTPLLEFPDEVKDSLNVARCPSNLIDTKVNNIATGSFIDTINQTGWSKLVIETNNSFPNSIQAYSAGLIEGQLTVQRTYEYITNVFGGSTTYSPRLASYVKDNLSWLTNQINGNPSDPYWSQVGLILVQLQGLYAGYSKNCGDGQQFDEDVFYAVQLIGELDDLCRVYGCEGAMRRRVETTANSHCSVLIKVLPSLSDIISGHTTWAPYETMTRIYKHYNFPFFLDPSSTGPTVAGQKIFFSSYPSTLFSNDDFYQINTGLMVTETTIENENPALWANIQPIGQVPNWIRTMLANRLATDGQSWMSIFQKYNSGTYNNQWMVVDYNKFIPGKELLDGTLYVGEQLPGYFVSDDLTPYLRGKGHWVSYNRPYFPFIFNISDQPKMVEKYGDHYDWAKTARAVLFAELAGSVVDEDSYKRVIRYNHFETDAVATQGCTSGRSASNAISERGDLTPKNAGCLADIAQQDEGGTDVKYTTFQKMANRMNITVVAQSGPTYDNQPPFVWSQSPFADEVSHIGQPDKFEFPWVTIFSG